MWVIIPVKQLSQSKLRLKDSLLDMQRIHFSYLLLKDTLQTLTISDHIDGITVVSHDAPVLELAREFKADFIKTKQDRGYNHDAMLAIDRLGLKGINKLAIIPADLPCLSQDDLALLDESYEQGVTLCEAEKDGGTNALIFTPPLPIPLMFGHDSFRKHRIAAIDMGVEVNIVKADGMKRDIDNEDDIDWLIQQPEGGKAWEYIRGIRQHIA